MAELVKKAGELIQIKEGIIQNIIDLVFIARQILDFLQHLLRDQVLVGFFLSTFTPKFELLLLDVTDQSLMLLFPSLQPPLFTGCLAVAGGPCQEFQQQPIAGTFKKRKPALWRWLCGGIRIRG